MDSESAVEKFVRNLSFEIETTTQSDHLRLKDGSKSTPLNVKVRLRKKNELPEYGVISVPKAYVGKEKIRLANSDQTVMSFDLFMEPDLQKKPAKKHRRKLIEIIRQSTCLGTKENDDYLRYLPSSSYKQSATEQSVSSNSDCLLNQATTLSKKFYPNSPPILPKDNYFLGKCKPGGCLDPPFGEDKYVYSPTIKKIFEPTRKHIYTVPDIVTQNSSSIRSRTENSDSSARHKPIINEQKDRNIILKLYQAESINTSLSTTHSNSIITYPPILTFSECGIYNDKNMHNNITMEVNKLQNTANQLCNAYFLPPKKVVKQLEQKKSENPNLSMEETNTLNINMDNYDILDNNSDQRKEKISNNFGHPTYVDTKLGENNDDDEVNIEAIEIYRQYNTDTERELPNKELQINEDHNSVPATLDGYLLSQDAHSYVSLSNDMKMDLLCGIYQSHNSSKLKLKNNDLSRINVEQILKQNNHHSSGIPKHLNTDFSLQILADTDNNVSSKGIEETTNILDKKLTNTKEINLVLHESVQKEIKQLSNSQNTMNCQDISELTSGCQPDKHVTHNYLTSPMSFMSQTKIHIEQDVPKVPKTTLESNESINNHDFDTNLPEDFYTDNKQNDEKNILIISDKLEGVTSSTVSIQNSRSDKENNIPPRHTTTDSQNLGINNKIKTLVKRSLVSVMKRSADSIHSKSDTKYISIKSISSLENTNSALEELKIDTIRSSMLDHIIDSQTASHNSELSVSKEEERLLINDSTMNTIQGAKEENITEFSIKASPVQKPSIVFFRDESKSINLKFDSFDDSVLLNNKNQNSSRNASFSRKTIFNKEFILPVRNNEQNEPDMELQITNEVTKNNNFPIVNSLSKSNSQLNPCDENVPLLVIQPHKMSNDIYKQKSVIEDQRKPFEIEKVSDLEPVVSYTSRIYVDKQLINKNVTLSDIKDSATPDLHVLGTQSQSKYSDVNKISIPESDLKTISDTTLIRLRNILDTNDKKKQLSVDLGKQLFNKNHTLSDIKDELDIKINKNSETYVATSTGITDMEVFGTQSQNEYSDLNTMNIREHDLKPISHSSQMRLRNAFEVNDKEKELSLDLNKQLNNKNLTLSDIKDELNIRINKISKTYVSTATGTTDLQIFDRQSRNEYSNLNRINIPDHEFKTISHTTLIRSKNILEENNDNGKGLSVDLAFQVYYNDKNQRFLRSFSNEHEPKRYTEDTLLRLKTEIKTSNYKLIVPIDTEKNLSIYIDKVNDRVELPQYTMNKGTQFTEQIKSLNDDCLNKIVNELRNGYLLNICENELIPLQMSIKGLKEEIDSLTEQQLIFKSSLLSVKKSKLIRFSNVGGKRCGCLKSYY